MVRPATAWPVCLLAAGITVLARSEPQDDPQAPVFRSAIDLVRIYVTVTDRDGTPVRGLSVEDFEVSEDGDARPVLSFASVEHPAVTQSNRDALASVSPDTGGDAVERRIAIVLNDAASGLMTWGEYAAGSGGAPAMDLGVAPDSKRIARAIVERLGPRDMAAVAFTEDGRFQDFTADRGKLEEALALFKPKASEGLCALAEQTDDDCLIVTIRRLAEAMVTDRPRRNVIVYIGPEVPHFVALNHDGTVGSDSEYVRTSGPAFEMYRAIHRASATVFAFDNTGLQVTGKGMEYLRGFTESTGGRVFTLNNETWRSVPIMFEQIRTSYILGLAPTAPDKPFQRIRVETKNRSYRTHTPNGYFATGAEPLGATDASTRP